MRYWLNRTLTFSAAGLYVLVAVVLYAPAFRAAELEPSQGHSVIPHQDGRHALRPVKSFVLAFPSRQDREWIAQDAADHLPPEISLNAPARRLLVSDVGSTRLVLEPCQRTRVRDPPSNAV